MLLTASDHSLIQLQVTGYQFPDGYEISGRTVYPDWLNVDGSVRLPDAQWEFSFPCLHSGEAVELGSWLRSIVDGKPTDKRIGFTEPNITIDLIDRSESKASFLFRFSQEMCPPGQADEIRLGDGYPVEFVMDVLQLRTAVDEWVQEIAPYPAR